MGKLDGKRIAILATRGVEQVELTEPQRLLKEEGAKVEVISPEKGKFKAWKFTEWGDDIAVDRPLDQAKPDDYDALVLPGGQINPDILRTVPAAVKFVRDFYETGKTVQGVRRQDRRGDARGGAPAPARRVSPFRYQPRRP